MNKDYARVHYIGMYFKSFKKWRNGKGRNRTFASVPVQSLYQVIAPLGLSVKLDLTMGKDWVKKVGNRQRRQ